MRLLADTAGGWENEKIIIRKMDESERTRGRDPLALDEVRRKTVDGIGGEEGRVEGKARGEILVNDGAEIGHTPAACKTRGEIKCFINVIKAKSCVSNEPR